MNQQAYEWTPDSARDKVLEQLREKIASVAGVTLQGNRLTVRWNNEKKQLVDVHMVIIGVDDGEPEPPEEDK